MPEAKMLEEQSIASLAALASPLPPPPEGEILTVDQWTTLLAICDTFISPVTNSAAATTILKKFAPASVDESTITAYLSETASSHPEFKSALHRKLGHTIPASNHKGLAFILTALNTRLGSLLLTSSPTPLHLHDVSTRTKILASWSTARLFLLRNLFRSFSMLSKQTWLTLSPTLPKLINFPKTPAHVERKDPFEFAFKSFPADATTPVNLTTDIVIIGSGCGAGVAALHLASAGHKVLILEKSYHFPATHFPMSGDAAGVHLLENSGTVLSDDGSIAILAGSTWGGGGTVNWSASLQPQHFVREEWARDGLPQFASAEFQDCLDTVCGHMGVAKATDEHALGEISQNFANKTLLEGARRLGMMGEIVPQNTAGKKHNCGYCGEGCASATKQGPANYWLPKAAEKGAEFIEGCWAEEVVFEETPGSEGWVDGVLSSKIKKAVGIKGSWTSRDRSTTIPITINAKRVIVSAGTLQSPLLLMRSSITSPHLGRNLHLHPTLAVSAVWPHPVRPWEGSILTSAITSLENQDGAFHGPKLEVIASTPGYLLPWMPWRASLSGNACEEFKVMAAKFGYMSGYISLQRDRDSGRVFLDPDDKERRRVRVAYTASERDCRGILEGAVGISRIVYTMGAREIISVHPGLPPFIRNTTLSSAESDAAFESWIAQMRKIGVSSPDPCMLGSAHQMGTCRMGKTARDGVVDGQGRVWGTEGLYVADASCFPSASGVNPMITTMGIAEWVSRGIVGELGELKEREGKVNGVNGKVHV